LVGAEVSTPSEAGRSRRDGPSAAETRRGRARPPEPRDPGRGPLLLALESATAFASVALLRDDALVVELTATGSRPHSTRLLPLVDRALGTAGVTLAQVDAFAISVGPGSFTGLRIGLATLQGLALGSARPVAAVSTLAGLACAAAGPDPVLACLDARRGEVYAAVFVPGREAEAPRVAEGVYRPEALAERIPRPCTLVGCAGEEAVLGPLAARLGDGVTLAPPAPPRAWHVGRLGRECLARGEGVAAGRVVPRYLRRAEAEARRTGQPFERDVAF
jgi:tRNA threonylcarbamoyladenosine biosynthesis protein TsaB